MRRYSLKTCIPLVKGNQHKEIMVTLPELVEYIQSLTECAEYVTDITELGTPEWLSQALNEGDGTYTP